MAPVSPTQAPPLAKRHQPKPHIIRSISKGKVTCCVRNYDSDLRKSVIVHRGSEASCQAFIDNGLRVPDAKPKKKAKK